MIYPEWREVEKPHIGSLFFVLAMLYVSLQLKIFTHRNRIFRDFLDGIEKIIFRRWQPHLGSVKWSPIPPYVELPFFHPDFTAKSGTLFRLQNRSSPPFSFISDLFHVCDHIKAGDKGIVNLPGNPAHRMIDSILIVFCDNGKHPSIHFVIVAVKIDNAFGLPRFVIDTLPQSKRRVSLLRPKIERNGKKEEQNTP